MPVPSPTPVDISSATIDSELVKFPKPRRKSKTRKVETDTITLKEMVSSIEISSAALDVEKKKLRTRIPKMELSTVTPIPKTKEKLHNIKGKKQKKPDDTVMEAETQNLSEGNVNNINIQFDGINKRKRKLKHHIAVMNAATEIKPKLKAPVVKAIPDKYVVIKQKLMKPDVCENAIENVETTCTAIQGTKLDVMEKYPILKDADLIKRFLGVTMTNNQKGRIRQVLKELLRGASEAKLPDAIHNRILTILNSSEDLTDTDLRKIRILYNMLKTATDTARTKTVQTSVHDHELKNKKRKTVGEVKEHVNQKVKGPKRYVVFVGNLPLNVEKEQILTHFAEFSNFIKDVRIPAPGGGKKSAIAYLELKDEPTYELALSKHHTMLGKKRINVLYTTQKGTKISKSEAKSKSAKLQAMIRSGQLFGSIPLKKKRSQRRAKHKLALKKLEQGVSDP